MKNEFNQPYSTIYIEIFSKSRPKPFLINAIGRNARSTAQDSLLSLHTPEDCTSIIAENIFEVQGADKYGTLQALEKLGFTADRLHHDITMMVDRFKAQSDGQRFPGWP